jgi:hypothetical protein
MDTGIKKQDLLDKMKKINAEQCGLMVMLHRIDEANIRFEIGQSNPNGTTRCIFSSKSIKRTISEYAHNEYTEKDGYRIDVWEGDQPIADISLITGNEENKTARVRFEINKKVVVGTTGDGYEPRMVYGCETVFRSASAMDCHKEWARMGYTKDDYVIDVREAPEGEESYHVADIDTDSMVKAVPKTCGGSWLVDLIKSHRQYSSDTVVGGKDIDAIAGRDIDVILADKITRAFKSGKV